MHIAIIFLCLLVLALLLGDESRNPRANMSYRVIISFILYCTAILVWQIENGWMWFRAPGFTWFAALTLVGFLIVFYGMSKVSLLRLISHANDKTP